MRHETLESMKMISNLLEVKVDALKSPRHGMLRDHRNFWIG